MHVDTEFFKLLEHYEGFVKCPYLDSVKVPTIGIGTTVYPNGDRVKMTDTCITYDQAQTFVRNHIRGAESIINAHCKGLTQNQFNALVSFAYNVGNGAFLASTLLKKVIANPNDPEIAGEFKKWVRAGGKILGGLVTRRKKEIDLYFKK